MRANEHVCCTHVNLQFGGVPLSYEENVRKSVLDITVACLHTVGGMDGGVTEMLQEVLTCENT